MANIAWLSHRMPLKSYRQLILLLLAREVGSQVKPPPELADQTDQLLIVEEAGVDFGFGL